MKAAIERFLNHIVEEQGAARNTQLAYATDLQQFARVLAETRGSSVQVGEITPRLMEAFAAWLVQQSYRPSTISRKMAAVRSFIDYLDQREQAQVDRLAPILKPPPAPRSRPRVLSSAEVDRLLQAAEQLSTPRGLRDAALIHLLFATGLRASDVVRLDFSDLDIELKRIKRAEAWIPLGEAGRPIRIYLAQGRPNLLRDHGERALFLNLRGKRLSRQGLWLAVKRCARAAGLGPGISPHSLRHSMIHHWLEQGRTKREIQRMLGLSSPNVIRGRRASGEKRDVDGHSQS